MRFLPLLLCLLLCGACAFLPGPKNQQNADFAESSETDSEWAKRQESAAIRAMNELRSRKKSGRHLPKVSNEVPWDEEIRSKHIEKTVKNEQDTVDRMPTAILRMPRKDAEQIADDESTPDFESKPALGDSEHAAMVFYRQGLNHVENRRWDAALTAFTKFLQEAPEHIYSDRAAYWISHCHYLAGDHGLAIYTSNQFESRFPHSQRLPEMIYYRALSHLELGQYEEAVPEFRSLLEKFPANSLAIDASKKLAEIQVQKEVVSP